MKVSFERISKYPDCCKSGALTFKRALGNREVYAHQVVGNPIPINDSIWFMSKELPIKVFAQIAQTCVAIMLRNTKELCSFDSELNSAITFDISSSHLFATTVHEKVLGIINKTQKLQNTDWYVANCCNHFILAQHIGNVCRWGDSNNLRVRLYNNVIACTTYTELFPKCREELLQHLKQLLIKYPNKE